jgi:hypothetical protein
MLRVPLGQLRVDAPLPQRLAVRLRVVRPIPIHLGRPVLRFPCLVQRAGAVHQGEQFLDLRRVRRSGIHGQRNAVAVHQNVLLDAGAAAIRGVFPAPLDAAEGAGEAAVHGDAWPVDLAGVVQALEQDLDELEPDAGLLPGVESAPTGHAAAAAHLDGEVFPGDAGFEDEEDAGQGLAVPDGFATGEAEPTGLGRRQQRLKDVPEFIGDQRLGHDSTSCGG